MSATQEPVRVHVLLSRIGLGSRREIESWIRSGFVSINRKPAKLGQKVDPLRDELKVRGKSINLRATQAPKVIAVHKPRGVVTTSRDPEGRQTILDLVQGFGRLFPVGRLDIMSEGLIFLTNDGNLAQHIAHPKYEVPKIYEVKIRGNLDDKKLEHLKKGISTSEGRLQGAEILNMKDVTRSGVKKFAVTVKIFEGKNHHVRKLFDAIKCRVIRLKRISIGPIGIKGIPRGGYKVLSTGDVLKLKKSVGL